MSEEDQGPSGQQVSFEKQLTQPSNNLPRTARARTGQTTDPLPPGKKVAEPQLHGEIKPAGHDRERAAAGAPGEGTKEDIKAHKKELQAMSGGDAKYKDQAYQPQKYQDVSSLANKTQREGKH